MVLKMGSIAKLRSSENYQGWAMMARAYLLRKGLMGAIESAENTQYRI